MKIKSAVFSVIAFVVLSVSTAWAAETPKPGKTKEETARNKAVLKCKTEYPVIVDAMVYAYSGKSAGEIKAKLRARFEKDRAEGTYYTTLNDRDPWIEKMGDAIFAQGREIKKADPDSSLYSVRQELTSRTDSYVKTCAANTYKALLD
ncbi:MAG: hypothetical protein WA194_09035 [Patescibacteria group bacterium]